MAPSSFFRGSRRYFAVLVREKIVWKNIMTLKTSVIQRIKLIKTSLSACVPIADPVWDRERMEASKFQEDGNNRDQSILVFGFSFVWVGILQSIPMISAKGEWTLPRVFSNGRW
jgi:hypothetical protein